MTITFLTTDDERKTVKHLDLTIESDFNGLDYIMARAVERAGRRIN